MRSGYDQRDPILAISVTMGTTYASDFSHVQLPQGPRERVLFATRWPSGVPTCWAPPFYRTSLEPRLQSLSSKESASAGLHRRFHATLSACWALLAGLTLLNGTVTKMCAAGKWVGSGFFGLVLVRFHFSGVDYGVQPLFVCFALEIRSGGRIVGM